MRFDPAAYGPEVAKILSLDGDGERLMPLAPAGCSSQQARTLLKTQAAAKLFPHSRSPEGALSGLFLYFSCLEESHEVAQRLNTVEGSFWHGIMHRQEPDPDNAAYWFRQVPSHAVFVPLAASAAEISARFPGAGLKPPDPWEPIRFIGICEEARGKPGSPLERMALEIQRAEWQLLFDYCARGGQGAL